MVPKILSILLAEDDEGHAELIQDGLARAGLTNPVRHFSDGADLWAFLEQTIPQGSCPDEVGYLVLLDINMPRMNGVEVLRRIKGEPCLKPIPVIMLTTTDDPREVEACYKLGCSFYITKPLDFPRFLETLKRLGLFLQVVQL